MKLEKIVYIDRRTGEKKTEKVPGEAFLKFLYHNPFGKLPLELLVKRKFLSRYYGRLMDRESSRKKIESFVKANDINMAESEKDIHEFRSFNDFFSRRLQPGSRLIGQGLVSPADGKVIAFDKVSQWDTFFVKGSEFSLQTFIRDDGLCERFADGTMIIVRLAPADYHRFHFPASGETSGTTNFEGAYYSVSPYAVKDNFGIFCQNKREYSLLETEDFGAIFISEIAATMVGTIVQSYKPGTRVEKGQEKGYFAFGGSSVLLLLEQGRVKVHGDIIENTKQGYESRVLMGESIGDCA